MSESTVLIVEPLSAWGAHWATGTAFAVYRDNGTSVEARAPNGDRVTLVRYQFTEVPLTLEALL